MRVLQCFRGFRAWGDIGKSLPRTRNPKPSTVNLRSYIAATIKHIRRMTKALTAKESLRRSKNKSKKQFPKPWTQHPRHPGPQIQSLWRPLAAAFIASATKELPNLEP